MGANGNVNVSIWKPGNTVASMLDEIADGSVERAVEAAKAAYRSVDSDGEIPVFTYEEDFDDAVAAAVAYAATTDGQDLLVLISDLVCNDPARAEQLLGNLYRTDDFAAVVVVSNQGYDNNWAKKLDGDGGNPETDRVDVIEVNDLSDEKTALAEVGPWAKPTV